MPGAGCGIRVGWTSGASGRDGWSPSAREWLGELKDAEWVQANWEKICSLEGAEPMWRTGQTLKAYLAEKAAQKQG